jgi:hypothetical protein
MLPAVADRLAMQEVTDMEQMAMQAVVAVGEQVAGM